MTGRKPHYGAHRLAAVAATLVLALSTGACYSYTGARYGGPDAPLQARVASTFDGRASLNFAVSDRAHVALFRIHDSGYVRALYPYNPGSTSLFQPGGHTVLTSTPSYRGGRSPFYRGGRSPFTRFAARYGPARSRTSASCLQRIRTSYIMIVASRQPLRMNRIRNDVAFRYGRVSTLTTPFYGGSAFGNMDRLLDRLIPRGLARKDWDVDWVVTTDIAPRCRSYRPPLLRRIAADTDQPAADDTASADTRRRRLDTGDVPFNPPKIPVDLPEITVDGSDGSGVRGDAPLPPVAVTPLPRPLPEGKWRKPSVEDGPERRPREADPQSLNGPSEHFGRLFGGGDRPEAAGWIPGWSEGRVSTGDRRVRKWARQMKKWESDPDQYEFPDPPRPPGRGAGGGHWPSDGRSYNPPRVDRPAHRADSPARSGDDQRIDPPTRTKRGGDIEVRRPSSSDHGGDSSARKSGGGSDDDGSGGHQLD